MPLLLSQNWPLGQVALEVPVSQLSPPVQGLVASQALAQVPSEAATSRGPAAPMGVIRPKKVFGLKAVTHVKVWVSQHFPAGQDGLQTPLSQQPFEQRLFASQ